MGGTSAHPAPPTGSDRHGGAERRTTPGLDAPTVDLRSTRRRRLVFPGRPALLGPRSWPTWAAAVAVLGVMVVLMLSGLLVTYPRALYWVPIVAVATVALAKVTRFTPGLVALLTVTVLAAWYADQLVSTAWSTHLGYDTSQQTTSVPALVAALGCVPLAAALCALVDEEAREIVTRWAAPQGTVDVLRLGVIVIALITALFPIGRAFTTGAGFGVVVAARDQVLFPGYASPGRVADGMRADFAAGGAPVNSVTCSYFAPNLGTPPVYNCTAVLSVAGVTEYHDNIQSTGRPDGTFSCSDYTESVGRRLC